MRKSDLDAYLRYIDRMRVNYCLYETQNRKLLEEMAWKAVVKYNEQLLKNNMNKDNLFSANHRNVMLEKYDYTDALSVTIEQLINDYELSR